MRATARLVTATALVAAVGLTAGCVGGAASSRAAGSSSPTPLTSSALRSSVAPSATVPLVGDGCAAYRTPSTERAQMATLPVALATRADPQLSVLSEALSGRMNQFVDLADTLDSGEFTVFAPVDDAFDAMSPAVLRRLATPAGAPELRRMLTYLFVAGRMTPEEIAGRTLRTVEGAALRVSGTAGSLRVQGVDVLCGGVPTANATVYLLDSVPTPPGTG